MHAALFGVAAALLPWPDFTVFGLLAGLLAFGYVITFGLALLGSPRRALSWRLTSLLSLGMLGYFTYATLSSGLYVNFLYEGVGLAILAASIAAWCVGLLFLLPLALWGISATGGLLRARAERGVGGGAAVLSGLVLLGFSAASEASAARSTPRISLPPTAIDSAVREALVGYTWPAIPKGGMPSLFVPEPGVCPTAPQRSAGVTVFATFLNKPGDGKGAQPTLGCHQATDLETALVSVRAALAERHAFGDVVIDVVESSRALPNVGALFGSVVVRPGLEGVCSEGICLLPWQLFGLDAFTEAANIAALQAEIGVTAAALRKHLGVGGAGFSGLFAFRTRTLHLDKNGKLTPLEHLRPTRQEPDSENVDKAIRLATEYIVRSQVKDGRYRYTMQPFTGVSSWEGFSVPRQAGTTLALCEAARFHAKAKDSAQSSLSFLAGLVQKSGEAGGIVFPKGAKRNAPLGPTALSTIALLGCRPLVGDKNDDAIVALGHGILQMQRPDGSFRPLWDPKTGAPIDGQDALYAAGQAVFALVLWEGSHGDGLPRPPGLADAIDRSMNHYGGPYWDIPLRDFFYLEENWHCLAARAALTHHRNESYERFCLDYMQMKKRFIQSPDSGVDAAHVGSYAFGHVSPPHHAAAGGFAEALAASMAIKKVRGLDTSDDERVMRWVLGLVVHHQYHESTCFFCTRKLHLPGGFSESAGSPVVRIDFVQHNMSALLHGGAELGFL